MIVVGKFSNEMASNKASGASQNYCTHKLVCIMHLLRILPKSQGLEELQEQPFHAPPHSPLLLCEYIVSPSSTQYQSLPEQPANTSTESTVASSRFIHLSVLGRQCEQDRGA